MSERPESGAGKRRVRLLPVLLFGLAAAAGAASPQPADPMQARVLAHVYDWLARRIPAPASVDWAGARGLILLGGQPSRYRAAIALAAEHPDLTIVVSGPSDWEMKTFLAGRTDDLRRRMRLELESLAREDNTYGNAVYTARLLAQEPGCWLLVTSAVHMPRALGVFEGAGFPVVPWPVRTEDTLQTKVYDARHEGVGLLVYRLLGRTRALVPSWHAGAPACAGRGIEPVRPSS